MQKAPRHAIIGYELKREHWGQGYIPEALHAMIKYGFAELQLNRLEAFVIPGNERSFKVLSKLGFVEEGILREYGFWKDSVLGYAMLLFIEARMAKLINNFLLCGRLTTPMHTDRRKLIGLMQVLFAAGDGQR